MTRETNPDRKLFHAPVGEWLRVMAFLLSMSLYGLQFYPAIILIILFLINHWRHDRYFFLVEFFVFVMLSGIVHDLSAIPFRLSDIALGFGLLAMIFYRKKGIIRTVYRLTLAYFAMLLAMAALSPEPLMSQFSQMRYYLLIITYFIPLFTFANRPNFDFQRFIHVVTLFVLGICLLYAVDTFIISGGILCPGAIPYSETTLWEPLLMPLCFPRHYPVGLYWLFIILIPLSHHHLRLRWYYWIIILLAIAATRTNSLYMALIVCWVLFRARWTQIIPYCIAGIAAIALLYQIDKWTDGQLRVVSTFEQFTDINKMTSDEDIAQLGTGRLAQFIPKFDLLISRHREATGFGFIHPDTENVKYQLSNDLYIDIEKSQESVSKGVEVTQLQTLLTIGYIGLTLQLLYYFGLYFVIRKLKYSLYYLCMLIGMNVLGIGGFAGLNGILGSLSILGLTLGTILLANKPNPTTPQQTRPNLDKV